jgi:CHAT domain-containing protein/Tfp pilus assembly protein PilF
VIRLRVLLMLSTVVAGLFAQDQARSPGPEWGNERSYELAAGRSQEHYVFLKAGQYARFNIAQYTVDTRVAVFDPAGKQLLSVDNRPIGEPEDAELIAAISGKYCLRVTTSEAHAPAGRYGFTLATVLPETARYRVRITAAHEVAVATAANRLGTREGMLRAIRYFESARLHWRAAEDPGEEARTMYTIAFIYIELGDRERALSYATGALPRARTAHDARLLGRVLDCLGEVHNNFSDKKTAIDYYMQALTLLRGAGDRAGEARTLSNLGVAWLGSGDKHKALELFDESRRILQPLQDRRALARVASNIGATYDNLGDYQLALENLQYALALRREVGDRIAQGLTLNNIGSAYSGLAEYQKALDAYLAALDIHRSYDSRWNMAVTLNNIGWIYAALGDRRHALSSYRESLELSRAIQDPRRTAVALNNIATLHAELGNYREAIELHTEALTLRRQTNDSDGEATSRTNLGEAYAKFGDKEKARDHFEAALAILRTSSNRPKLVRTLRGLGALKRTTRDFDKSRECLDEALKIGREIRDQNGEASVLGELARLEYDLGNLPAARRLAEQTLSAFEALRLRVVSPNLRASLVASTREVHEMNIDILERLHAEDPSRNFDAEAFRAAERGRARSLLEVLGESGAGIRLGVDQALLDRERDLYRHIANRADQQTQLLNRKHTPEEAEAAARELDRLASELEQVQSRIRETSPQYAALTSPATLELTDIQSKLLDQDTVLLEYELGAQKSFLWVVTRSSVTSFELGPRARIESAARHVYELLTARNLPVRGETPSARAARVRKSDQDYFAAAVRLSDILLRPAAPQIAGKRLLIVAEGVLQYLPFSALPEPAKEAPLMVEHEVVTAPSASVLAVLRQETAMRRPAEQLLFVAADPVYSETDPRVGQHRIEAVAFKESDGSGGTDSGAAYGNAPYLRLRFSRTEAEQIASLVPAADVVKAFDFDANRDAVLNLDLARFRILHFATHSLLDDDRPELSGIVLSLVDRTGRRQNGFLRLFDIYNLRLNADLAVLSACRTALGPEIRGEGLIGLTRGFFYAGAPRVLASLWPIDDRTGAAFMKPFYEAMLVLHERPAAALRSAQIALWKTKGWDAPYYWAAFALQGEWK